MKKNGCNSPFTCSSITLWVYIILKISTTFIFTSRLVNAIFHRYHILILVIFISIYTIVIIFHLSAMLIDSKDPLLNAEINKKEYCEKNKISYCIEVSPENEFCILCCSNVLSNSKHCSKCNKCVDNFDHHCDWFNNCIGSSNYMFFILYTIFLFLSVLLYIGIGLYVSIYSLKNINEFKDNIQDNETANSQYSYNLNKKTVIYTGVITIFFCLLDTIVFFYTLYLLLLHCYLKYLGLSTYEYYIQNIKNNEEESNKKEIQDQSNQNLKADENNIEKRNENENIDKLTLDRNITNKKKILENNYVNKGSFFDRIKSLKIDSNSLIKSDKNKDVLVCNQTKSQNKLIELNTNGININPKGTSSLKMTNLFADKNDKEKLDYNFSNSNVNSDNKNKMLTTKQFGRNKVSPMSLIDVMNKNDYFLDENNKILINKNDFKTTILDPMINMIYKDKIEIKPNNEYKIINNNNEKSKSQSQNSNSNSNSKKNCNLKEKKCQNKESGSSMSSVFQLESNSSLNINSKVNSDKDKLGVELESDKKYTDDKLSKKQSNQNQQNIEVLSWKSSDIDCK